MNTRWDELEHESKQGSHMTGKMGEYERDNLTVTLGSEQVYNFIVRSEETTENLIYPK